MLCLNLHAQPGTAAAAAAACCNNHGYYIGRELVDCSAIAFCLDVVAGAHQLRCGSGRASRALAMKLLCITVSTTWCAGQLLASLDSTSSLCLWAIPTGVHLAKHSVQEHVLALAFAASSKQIAAVSAHAVIVWDIAHRGDQVRICRICLAEANDNHQLDDMQVCVSCQALEDMPCPGVLACVSPS